MPVETASVEIQTRRVLRLHSLSFSDSIRWIVLGIPLLYVLGLDQFILPFMAIFLAWQLAWQRTIQGRGIVLSKVARLGLAFVLIQIFAGLFIIEKEFYIVYARNVLAWTGGVLFLIILTNVMSTRAHLSKLLWSWTYLLLLAALVAVVAFFLREGFQLRTVALYIVPSSMRDGITAATVWTRSFLTEPVPFMGQMWYRVRSFFLYANTYAGVLVITIPLVAYLLSCCRRFSVRWWLILVTLGLSALALLITTSRAGLLSLLITMGLFVFLRTRRSDRIIWVLLMLVGIIVMLSFLLIDFEESFSSLQTFLEDITMAKGTSHLTRLNILTYSLISWRERPIFGWGSPREMAPYGFPPAYPRLGSHSQFLSVLYRTGIVGMFFYVWLLMTLWLRFREIPSGDWRWGFRPFLLWAFTANLLHSVFTQLDIDLLLLFFVWQLWAIIDVLPKLAPLASSSGSGKIRA